MEKIHSKALTSLHVGVDFGARMAGTTAVCYAYGQRIFFAQSGKGKDADGHLLAVLGELKPKRVFMDAPLSLPGAYAGNGADFHFRECDKTLKAMSPMFLGGLTARAIQLKNLLEPEGYMFFEAYPAGVVRKVLNQHPMYDKKGSVSDAFIAFLEKHFDVKFEIKPVNWHQIDSFLAWCVGTRFEHSEAEAYGNPCEGLVWV